LAPVSPLPIPACLQGFLFRFAAREVVPASKARGIVDLSTVTDVSDAGSTTGRPNSIKLSTATGHICYLCENETSQVEWFSALEGAVAKIVKQVAGVDEAEEDNIGASNKAKSWAEQLEKTYASAGEHYPNSTLCILSHGNTRTTPRASCRSLCRFCLWLPPRRQCQRRA
jgi:hypothetical protein